MKIVFHRRFEKKFIKLSRKIRNGFKERMNLFIENPFHPQLNNHALTGERRSQWSINITGDWRAIYVLKGEDTVIFIDIDTHSNLYK